MTFNINWDKQGVYVKFRGIVNAQDLIDANNYVISNKSFDNIDYQVFDFISIDEFKITKDDITLIGMMNKSQSEFKNTMKIGVVTQDDYIKEITFEYDKLMNGSNWLTKIFSDVDSARKWCVEK